MTGKFGPQIISIILLSLFMITQSLGIVTEKNGYAELPDELLKKANTAYSDMELLKAEGLYKKAEDAFLDTGDETRAWEARNMRFKTNTTLVFYANRSDIEKAITLEFQADPSYASLNLSPQMFEDIFSDPTTEYIIIEGQEKRYYWGVIANYLFKNGFLKELYKKQGSVPFYDAIAPFVYSRSHNNAKNLPSEVIYYQAQAALSVPNASIPEHGILKIWIPTPIETESQTNVSVSIEPFEWVVRKPDTRGEIGYAYLEVPAESVHDDLKISCLYEFTSHERRDLINPEQVGTYNVTDKEYLKYTRSSQNQMITPDITRLARSIIGTETNPYLQAHLIYQYVIKNITYGYVPHGVCVISESEYVLRNGFGDCGSQSNFFVAVCRSIGIPARTSGAMHDINGPNGYHAWAEVNIPGYGWIPVDTSIGQAVDNSFNATPDEVHQFQEYFFGNQDPFRYYVQKDADLPVIPEPAYDINAINFLQGPIIECNESRSDPSLDYSWTINFKRVNYEMT
ncbi:MAG TPA: transglutaminase domain-containing protein [Methanospirillum sp.]|nr:transglutaminase domain-containing protein [Methanospirillum sp.]